MRAARGFDEVCAHEDFALANLEVLEMAYLLLEFCSSQRIGSGAFFFMA